jgi:16S rRNA (guanine527-N7)-methyltransferase
MPREPIRDWSAVREALDQGLVQLALQFSESRMDQLVGYLQMLDRWNGAYNLTAIREPHSMVYRHILDSLAILRLLGESDLRVADVGTGAGVPGIPLAIALPGASFDLVDSNGKKCRFLFQVKTELGLANMAVRHVRVEQWRPHERFDVVASRAFASLADMIDQCAHLSRPGGVILAMKGQYPVAELDALPDCVKVCDVHRLQVPGLDEERHVVEMQLAPKSESGEGEE